MKFSEDNIVIIFTSINFQFHMFDHSDRSKELPHLLYDADSTQFDFTLQDIDTGNYSSARWGLETVLLGSDKKTAGMHIETKKSIDDEYTPGVFEVFRLIPYVIVLSQFSFNCTCTALQVFDL